MIRNRIEHIRLPLIEGSSTVLVKMLSITNLESGVILVGLVVCGDNYPKYIMCDVKREYIFNLILVGIPSCLILTVKNR